MVADLGQLRDALRQGQRLSGQISLERRAPAAKAVPYLKTARDGLRQYVADTPTSVAAWRLLAEAEECLLDYGAALRALQKAIELSGKRDRRDVKKLVFLQQADGKWADLGLTPAQLASLGRHLEAQLAGGTGDRSLRLTREWLAREEIAAPERVIAALDRRGAFSDFQVLYNVVRG